MTNLPKLPSNRNFGIVFFAVFLIISFYPLTYNGDITKWSLVVSIIFLILGLINSKFLTPLNKSWIKLGEILGIIIAPIVMALVYFVILTPVSFIVRIFGKDLLSLKLLKEKETYWIERKKSLGSMKKQF